MSWGGRVPLTGPSCVLGRYTSAGAAPLGCLAAGNQGQVLWCVCAQSQGGEAGSLGVQEQVHAPRRKSSCLKSALLLSALAQE